MAGELMHNERRVAEWSEPRFTRVPEPPEPSTASLLKSGLVTEALTNWLFRLDERAARAGRPVMWMIIVGLCVSFGAVLFHSHPFEAVGLVLCPAALGVASVLSARLTSRALSKADLGYGSRVLADALPDSMPAMAVRLSFLVDGHPYAEDSGVLALTDGWLIFEGCRTEFSLAPRDCSGHGPLEPVNSCSRAEFSIGGLDADVEVLVQALDLKDPAIELLAMWKSGSVPASSASVLPPLERIPDEVALGRGQTVFRAVIAASGSSTTAILLFCLFQAVSPGGLYSEIPGRAVEFAAFLVVFWLRDSLLALKNRKLFGRRRALARLAECRRGALESAPPLPADVSAGFVAPGVKS